MKTNYFVLLALLLSGILTSCSSESYTQQIENGNDNLTKISTSFSPAEFQEKLDIVSNSIKSTRSSELNEELAHKLIHSFIEDGRFIQKQYIEDKTLTQGEKDSISNWSDEQLAILSLYANAINTEIDNPTKTRAVNQELHCLSEALVGAGSISGGLTWALIKKVGTKTALRMATSALGGMVGTVITVAIIANDYNACMQKN